MISGTANQMGLAKDAHTLLTVAHLKNQQVGLLNKQVHSSLLVSSTFGQMPKREK